MKQCSNCKFFIQIQEFRGECRFNPPCGYSKPEAFTERRQYQAVWPIVNTNDFCEKHESREELEYEKTNSHPMDCVKWNVKFKCLFCGHIESIIIPMDKTLYINDFICKKCPTIELFLPDRLYNHRRFELDVKKIYTETKKRLKK